jgi:ribosomal protein S18 acetylase RimI-like enzyme
MRLVPMSEKEFEVFERITSEDYAASNIEAGYWKAEGALERAISEREKLLPEGLRTRDHYFFSVKEKIAGEAIGYVWLKVDLTTPAPSGYIFYVYVNEGFRGLGYGIKIMAAIERKAKDMGLKTLHLHVFAQNSAALHLYEKARYRVSSMNMVKPVE